MHLWHPASRQPKRNSHLGHHASFQWMRFNGIDENRKQHGFGLAIGLIGAVLSNEQMAGSMKSYGPVVSLIFPKFNSEAGKYSAFQLNMMILTASGMTAVVGGGSFMF